MPNLDIRPAREADLPALVELARRSWLSAFALTVPFPVLADWVRRDPVPGWYGHYWPEMHVAEQDGRVVGVVQPRADEINGLWVDPDMQGRGLGPILLREGERRIAEAGYPRAWLTVSGFNLRAQCFYVRHGYAERQRRVERLGCGVDEDIIIMDRRLDPAATPGRKAGV